MNAKQITALLTPIIVTIAGLLLHYLSVATIQEIATVGSLLLVMLNAVVNVFVQAPQTGAGGAVSRKVAGTVGVLLVLLALVGVSRVIPVRAARYVDEVSLTGCTKAQVLDAQTAVDVAAPVFTCVLAQIINGGIENPQQIVNNCSGATIPIVATVISVYMGAGMMADDAGAAAVKPGEIFLGLPPAVVARLTRTFARARGMQ